MQTHDDRLTFLLPRPVWVNDMDVYYCSSCNSAFGPLKRRHHCRNCGNIFCHECSTRNVPLPQLGYGTKPVRVCNGCFDVAYLVTYAIDEDHGISTQMHGVRGLLELAEKDDEKDLHNMVAYGGVDALIWLCRSSKSMKLHHLTTTILAMLAEKESIRPVIITKWALPPLLSLIRTYTQLDCNKKSPTPNSSIHSTATPPSLHSDPAAVSESSTLIESRQSVLLEIVINCTHILYQLSRAGILSQKEVIQEGIFDTLLMLASFSLMDQSDEVLERVHIVQSLAAKSISSISSLVSFQASMIELVQDTDKLSTLLRSPNEEVRKYIAKTVAYLSLRNDKYKPTLLNGNGSRALVSILATLPQQLDIVVDQQSRRNDLAYYLSNEMNDIESADKKNTYLNSATVSHACCALANFATNNESQINLMSQPHILQYICNVPSIFPTHTEIYRHVARCLANLALYKENNEAMLATAATTEKEQGKDAFNVVPTLLLMGKEPAADIKRHIVRAIDNLSSNASSKGTNSQDLFNDAFLYISNILQEVDQEEKDDDTIKRAKNILTRQTALESTERYAELSKPKQDVNLKEDSADETDKVSKALTQLSLEVPHGGVIITTSSTEEEEDSISNDSNKPLKTPKNKKKSKKTKK